MTRNEKNNRGSALVMALAVLGIVVTFGFAMYEYSALERQDASVDLNKGRVLADAKSGVEEAAARLQEAIASGKADTLLGNDKAIALSVGIYHLAGREPGADGSAPVADERYASNVSVSISDECARMNVNLAPPAVLMAMLNIDGEKARQVRERLPKLDAAAGAEDNGRHWLSSVDELAGLKILPAEALTAERAADLTVFSALDVQHAAEYLNLNTASKAVLQAALGISAEAADKVMLARPLTSLDGLVAAAGKDANGFNFKPAPNAPGALPKELAFSSRCFRITSTAKLTNPTGSAKSASATVEAVLQFPENAAPRIVYWSETPGEANKGA